MILVAPDSFKGSLSASEVAKIIKDGLLHKGLNTNEIYTMPLSDGGDGFLACLYLQNKQSISWVECPSKDAVGRPIIDRYLWDESSKTAMFEMANSCGLAQLEISLRNPFRTSTFGTGMSVLNAIKKGAKTIILGMGGSATNDAGAGFLHALGVQFFDGNGSEIPYITGGILGEVEFINFSALSTLHLDNVTFIGATDVENPLLGKEGATYTFALQKGAKKQHLSELNKKLTYFASKMELANSTSHVDSKHPGCGAAGGLGFGFLHLPNSHLESGFKLFANYAKLSTVLEKTTTLITAEGRMDAQSLKGKAPYALLKMAKELNPAIQVIGLSAAPFEGKEKLKNAGFDQLVCIQQQSLPFEQAKSHTEAWLLEAVVKLEF